MHHSHLLGFIIRTIREMAIDGASIAAILAYLEERCPDSPYEPFRYLAEAFPCSRNYLFTLAARPITADMERAAAEMIAERRSTWQRQRYPELMRLEDYFAFSRFSVDEQLTVFVSGANRHAGAYIGRPGFECYDGSMFVVSRESAPHAGLLAADPTDPHLQSALGAFSTPLTYDQYCELLCARGLHVLGPEDGYILETADGARLYEGYRLHGVYDSDGQSAWRAGRGEGLRGLLNRHLGDDLVRFGPHDDWQHRNDAAIAGPLRGPQFPIIQFDPDGHVENHLNPDDLRSSWHYGDHWAARYPDLANAPSGSED